MKYSLMSLMIDPELKVKKPNFIHKTILKEMGYDGPEMSAEEMFRFFREHGVPVQNGSMTFRDYVKFAKENGFDGVDVMSFHFEEEGEDARKILEEFGMTISAVNHITDFGNAASEETFEKCFSETKEIMDRTFAAGCHNILLMPVGYRPASGMTREMIFRNMVKGLKACVAYGNLIGMTVNTETLESIAIPLCSKGEMLRIFEAVPGLKYNHDSGNPLVAIEDPVEMYTSLKDRVVNVHFKDLKYTEKPSQIMDPMGRYLELACSGEGLIDFKEHLKQLKRDDYQGFITIEGVRPAKDQLEGAVKALEYFKQIEAEL